MRNRESPDSLAGPVYEEELCEPVAVAKWTFAFSRDTPEARAARLNRELIREILDRRRAAILAISPPRRFSFSHFASWAYRAYFDSPVYIYSNIGLCARFLGRNVTIYVSCKSEYGDRSKSKYTDCGIATCLPTLWAQRSDHDYGPIRKFAGGYRSAFSGFGGIWVSSKGYGDPFSTGF